MTQRELDRAVCEATGEDLMEVQRRGFSFSPLRDEFEPEPLRRPQVVDWDALDLQRSTSIFCQRSSNWRQHAG